MLGKLTLAAIPYQNPIIFGAIVFMALVVVAVPATITVLGKWKYLWTEWLTSVDHKKIGAMYVILAGVMLLRGFADAIMMRAQQALAYGPHTGYLPPEHFDQVFQRPRHDHDLLHGDAVHDRADELRAAAADRRPRRRFPVPQFAQPLADGRRRDAGQPFAGRRQLRPHGLAGLSAAVGAALQPGCRRRLLHLGAADLGHRHDCSPASTSSPPS